MIRHEVTGKRLEPYGYPARIPEQIQLIQEQVYDGVNDRLLSKAWDSYSFRHFTLYLKIQSVGEGTHEICFFPQWGITTLGGWHDYAQGLFAALCYEDVDTAGGLLQAFSGDCDGRFFRLRVIPTNVDTTYYFIVSAWVEFWS